jgi:hypothetical protein
LDRMGEPASRSTSGAMWLSHLGQNANGGGAVWIHLTGTSIHDGGETYLRHGSRARVPVADYSERILSHHPFRDVK